MFCTKCSRSANGARPMNCAPSPPIWVSPTTWPTCSGGRNSTIAWQPMPPPTRASGSALIEELCGQPEQKYGVRQIVPCSGPGEPARGSRGLSRA